MGNNYWNITCILSLVTVLAHCFIFTPTYSFLPYLSMKWLTMCTEIFCSFSVFLSIAETQLPLQNLHTTSKHSKTWFGFQVNKTYICHYLPLSPFIIAVWSRTDSKDREQRTLGKVGQDNEARKVQCILRTSVTRNQATVWASPLILAIINT